MYIHPLLFSLSHVRGMMFHNPGDVSTDEAAVVPASGANTPLPAVILDDGSIIAGGRSIPNLKVFTTPPPPPPPPPRIRTEQNLNKLELCIPLQHLINTITKSSPKSPFAFLYLSTVRLFRWSQRTLATKVEMSVVERPAARFSCHLNKPLPILTHWNYHETIRKPAIVHHSHR